ncbi:hypothetical protein HUG17_7080 [Dermatophagoides farinae]|uniref:Uncharacterized protein n=1 Tax=Dermatophagoides farinae TaxID=6954 RepID=A0A9D4NRH7_DERFA|nr:hypothetical protein HUG17_7080 [Dermatophagoides farinae]
MATTTMAITTNGQFICTPMKQNDINSGYNMIKKSTLPRSTLKVDHHRISGYKDKNYYSYCYQQYQRQQEQPQKMKHETINTIFIIIIIMYIKIISMAIMM